VSCFVDKEPSHPNPYTTFGGQDHISCLVIVLGTAIFLALFIYIGSCLNTQPIRDAKLSNPPVTTDGLLETGPPAAALSAREVLNGLGDTVVVFLSVSEAVPPHYTEEAFAHLVSWLAKKDTSWWDMNHFRKPPFAIYGSIGPENAPPRYWVAYFSFQHTADIQARRTGFLSTGANSIAFFTRYDTGPWQGSEN
jgi:hypothetical protein